MTLDEYAQKVGDALHVAHNDKDRAALERTFTDANAKIDTFLGAVPRIFQLTPK